MMSTYWIDWTKLSTEEKIITLIFFAIVFIIAIIDYFYNKYKKDKKWQKLFVSYFNL